MDGKLKKHYILYPNPSPKKKHLLRRFYAHPCFKYMLDLGGEIELRTNWEILAKEFYFALKLLTEKESKLEEIRVSDPLTLFEKKYHESDHALYRVTFAQ